MRRRGGSPVAAAALAAAAVAVLAAAAVAAATLTACAAMKREWQFEPAGTVDAAPITLSVRLAEVSQKAATLYVQLRNAGTGAVRVELGKVELVLPDGTVFEGYGDIGSRTKKAWNNLLDKVGLGDDEEAAGTPIPPGEELEVKIGFRQYGRDLRRFAVLKVRFPAMKVGGKASEAGVMELRAPPEAPIGEGI